MALADERRSSSEYVPSAADENGQKIQTEMLVKQTREKLLRLSRRQQAQHQAML
jgi:hypothetical protein